MDTGKRRFILAGCGMAGSSLDVPKETACRAGLFCGTNPAGENLSILGSLPDGGRMVSGSRSHDGEDRAASVCRTHGRGMGRKGGLYPFRPGVKTGGFFRRRVAACLGAVRHRRRNGTHTCAGKVDLLSGAWGEAGTRHVGFCPRPAGGF